MASVFSKYPEVLATIPQGSFTVDDLGADKQVANRVLSRMTAKGYAQKLGKVLSYNGRRKRYTVQYRATQRFWNARHILVGGC